MKTLLIALCTLLALTANANAAEQKASQGYAIATFAGGCFWCMEPPFDKLDGVISTTSGYMGGHVDNPAYQQVSKGGTGHAEVMQVTYDPDRISYKKLLQTFWKNVDPTDAGGQFCDRGNQYRTGIFYHSEAQRQLAQQSKTALVADKPFSDEIVTPIVQASSFYPAEEYHQNYYQKNPIRYKYYRFSCGRDARLERLWGD
ncbi:MAG: peptide-methionine (S)-S-oxide reductase MsrA [Pseudomonadales bacterium]